jgi:HK97 family phage major capsid protein
LTGIRFQAASENVTASNGTTATNIESDFKDLLQALEGNDVPMVRPGWIMPPRSKNHLITLRDSNGNLIYPEIRNANPTIHTHPVFITNNIPQNLGAGNETELYLVDASEVIFGEVAGLEIAVSPDASYTVSGNTFSAFQGDQTLMRATLRHDIALKHDVAVAVKIGVTWGA